MSHRRESVAEHVRQVLSYALNFEMGDPGLEGLALTHVKLSPDFQYADVLYALPEGDTEEEAEAALNRAKPALRRAVAQKVKMRRVPELRFHIDRGMAATQRIEAILETLKTTPGSDHDDRD